MGKSYKGIMVLTDNGHGGVIGGVPQTKGKRSPTFEDGSVLYEGVFTRDIVNKLMARLVESSIPFVNIVPEDKDISLRTRTNRANSVETHGYLPVYFSVHSNAHGDGSDFTPAKGFECFTSKGQTKSDVVATVLDEEFVAEFPTIAVRRDYIDGDSDKEGNLFVLNKTSMPAVLLEFFFMTNRHECREYLMTSNGRDRITNVIFKSIIRLDGMIKSEKF